MTSATLWVVATPIGNLDDFSPRARHCLDRVAIIAAEDTRVSRRLGCGAQARWVSLHEHNERSVVGELIEQLSGGADIALVSDAGTPLISDPGYRLVSAAHDAGITVSPIPGPCAAIAALSAAGLPSDRFSFEGFLPARRSARTSRLQALADAMATLVFYVPARDLPAVLGDLAGTFGPDRQATVARELSKRFETIRRDAVGALAEWAAADPDQQRGEAVLVVAGHRVASDVESPGDRALARRLAGALADELPPSRAARVIGRVAGLSRQEAWRLVQEDN